MKKGAPKRSRKYKKMSSIGKITGTVCRLTHNDGIKRQSLLYPLGFEEQKNPALKDGIRHKIQNLRSLKQKTDGASRSSAQIENIKRQSLGYSLLFSTIAYSLFNIILYPIYGVPFDAAIYLSSVCYYALFSTFPIIFCCYAYKVITMKGVSTIKKKGMK